MPIEDLDNPPVDLNFTLSEIVICDNATSCFEPYSLLDPLSQIVVQNSVCLIDICYAANVFNTNETVICLDTICLLSYPL